MITRTASGSCVRSSVIRVIPHEHRRQQITGPSSLFRANEQGVWYDPSDIKLNWRRNLLTYSEDFSRGAWVKRGSLLVVPNDTIAPDGSTTADRISGLNIDNNDMYNGNYQLLTRYASISYTPSFFVKRISNSGVFMISNTVHTNIGQWNIDLSKLPDSWIRITASTPGVTVIAPFVTDVSGSAGILWRGISEEPLSMHIWGAQLEIGTSATEYQKITDGVSDYYTYQPLPVLYQDAAGTIPVTAVEQPVGLMLDKSKNLLLGPELIVNGDFSNGGTGWVYGSTWNLSGGNAAVNSTVYTQLRQSPALVLGKVYKFEADINITSSAFGQIYLGGAASGEFKTPGANHVIRYFTCVSTSNDLLVFSPNIGLVATVDNISIREVLGNHAYQATSANRPTLSARYNLLKYSEDFSNAIWQKNSNGIVVTPNSAIAPDGSLTADLCYNNPNSPNSSWILQSITTRPTTENSNYIFSIWLKSSSNSAGSVDLWIWDAISGYINRKHVTVTPEWQRFTYTALPSINQTTIMVGFELITADGVYAWGADLRPSNHGTDLPPYQRVTTDTDYDTVGFPPYLAFNGTNSSMATNSIDFSATDKMSVWAGVRKLTTSPGTIAELSATDSGNNGMFSIFCELNTNTYTWRSKGTIRADLEYNGFQCPLSNVVFADGDISSPKIQLRVNGSLLGANTNTQGTGNYGNHPIYIGARSGASIWFNGNIYSLIVRGAQSTDKQVSNAESWINKKIGKVY